MVPPVGLEPTTPALQRESSVKLFDKKMTYMIHNQLLSSKYYSHIIHIMTNEGVLVCRIVVPFIPVV